MLAALQEFDILSQNIKTEVINKTENNFAKITSDNITRVLYVLVETSNYNSNKVQISQSQIAAQLKLSENRISELLKLAKKAGLIAIDMICRCGDIRNEYTILDNPITNSIKKIVFKSQQSDSRERIDLEISHAMSFYKSKGVADYILETVKNRMENMDIKKASGVFNYFRKTLLTVKRESIEPTDNTTTYNKKKKDRFNDYEQRTYNFDKLEKKLLGYAPIEEIEEEPYDNQDFINIVSEYFDKN